MIPSTIQNIKANIPDITVKFKQHLGAIPEQGKKVELQFVSENGFKIRALVNRKSLQKVFNKMSEYQDWLAVVNGKLAEIDGAGFLVIEEAGIQIFEVKPKEKKEKKQDSESMPLAS